MTLSRRMLGALAFAAGSAQAQPAFPTQPIRLVLPQPPGSANDTVARIIAEPMGRSLGQPVHQRLRSLPGHGAARHQQGVNAAALPQCGISQQTDAGGGPHYRVTAFASDLDAVQRFRTAGLRMQIVGCGKHAQGTRDIEDFRTVMDSHDDEAWGS